MLHLLSSRRQSVHTRRWLASCAAVLLLITLAAGNAAGAPSPSRPSAGDPTVISGWNAIAVSTLAGDTTKQPVEDILYLAFVQAAAYNAVVGVEGRYVPTGSMPMRRAGPRSRRPRWPLPTKCL